MKEAGGVTVEVAVRGRKRRRAGVASAACLLLVPVAIIGLLALWTLLCFLPSELVRARILGYWIACLVVTLAGMHVVATHTSVPQVSSERIESVF